MQNNLSLQEYSILSPLVFFDIFNYPLTVFEIYKFYYQVQNSKLKTQSYSAKLKVSEIQNILENSNNLKKTIESKNGFYFLRGREELLARRRDLYRDAEVRWKKLQRVANILQYIPNVKMIAACNTLPINDFKPESDIDAFIIVKRGRLWLTRFLVTAVVSLMGEWRHKKRIANKICLSFYITDDAVNLSQIAKKPYDIYLVYWIAMAAPLYASKNWSPNESQKRIPAFAGIPDIYQQFLQANSWVKNYLPNFVGYEPVEFERKVGESKFLKSIKEVKEAILDTRLGGLLENFFRKIQKNKMARNYQSATRRAGSDVIISNQMLKFHEIDRRLEFRQKFELKLAKILESVKES